jgi:hypothetical protein
LSQPEIKLEMLQQIIGEKEILIYMLKQTIAAQNEQIKAMQKEKP